jgi:hypothetical protein
MREGATATASDRPRRWLLAGASVLAAAGVVAVLLAVVFVVPRRLYPPLPASRFAGVTADKRIELETNRLKLQNDARATLLQALAGGVLLLGAFFTWWQLRVAREGQRIERFTHAIDLLGTDNQPEVVFGGIYALERIARDRDSSYYRPIIGEILAAYVRAHAPDEDKAEDALNQLLTLQWRAPDVQAALAVLGGLTFGIELDLRGTDLRNADLKEAKFKDVRLYGANLQGARLRGADLQDARLDRANLQDAQLQGARLDRANLQGARLDRANLQGARLDDAKLQGARLHHADLRGAQLNGANFQGAQVDTATLRGALADGTTKWPAEFDHSAAGVVLLSEGANADRPP